MCFVDSNPRRGMDITLSIQAGNQQLSGDVIVSSVLHPQSQTPLPPGFEGGPATPSASGSSFNPRRLNSEKWEDEERLGERSSIAPVLFANMLHPNLRTQFPEKDSRFREIQKLWRRLPSEKRAQFVVSFMLYWVYIYPVQPQSAAK